MAIDGFLVKHLVNEFNKRLVNLRVSKITQNRKDIIVFHFNKSGEKIFLNFKLTPPNASAFITSEINQNGDLITTGFISSLKRLFESAIIIEIKQHLSDRVIIFDFLINDFLDGQIKRSLVFEIMGRQNNLVILENNIIIDAFNKKFNDNSRSIIPKLDFTFFPSTKLNINTINYNLVDHPLYLANNYLGFSPLISKYLFDNPIDIYKVALNPTYNKKLKSFYWFNIYNINDELIHFDTISNMLAYLVYDNTNDFIKQNNFINNELIKLLKRRANLEQDLFNANENLKLQDIGNSIYASGLNLNEKYSEILDYTGNTIKLNSMYTLNENAKNAFIKYRKATRAISHINKNITETYDLEKQLLEIRFFLTLDNINIEEINEELIMLGYKIKKTKQRKQQAPLKLLKMDYLNTLIYVGKNNKQNDYITHKLSSRSDYWLHVEGAPGSHVLIKDSNPTTEVLEFAAMLAANYSTLKDNNKINVNYTQIRNLKKIPGKSGHMVILNSYKTLTTLINMELINDVLIANKLK